MIWSKPNISKLKAQRDLDGLLKAMLFAKGTPRAYTEETQAIRDQAFRALLDSVTPKDAILEAPLLELLKSPRDQRIFGGYSWNLQFWVVDLLAKISPEKGAEALSWIFFSASESEVPQLAFFLAPRLTSGDSLAVAVGRLRDPRLIELLQKSHDAIMLRSAKNRTKIEYRYREDLQCIIGRSGRT